MVLNMWFLSKPVSRLSVVQHARSIFTILETISADRVQLTTERYPKLKRKAFAKLRNEHLLYFRSLLLNDPDKISTDEETLLMHNTDWLKTLRGQSPLVLTPGTVQEVSDILKYCHSQNLAVVPQGASTSMVGGSVPVFDEIILNTSLLNKVEDVCELSGTVTCGPGCTIQDLDRVAAQNGMQFPVDFKIREAQLGGLVAADIAGPRSTRYGVLHANVVGLEVVLPDGTVFDSMSTMKKDNSGYDLKHIFVGSEGTLGVITKAAISCPPRPGYINIAMIGCDTYEKVLKVFGVAKQMLGEIVSAIEYMDQEAVKSLKKNFWSLWRLPHYPFTVMIETAGVCDPHDEDKLARFLEHCKTHNLLVDGTIGNEVEHVQRVWSIYERILTSLVKSGYVYQFDLGLPQQHLDFVVREVTKFMEGKAEKVVGYGHLFDGSLNLSVLCRQYDQETEFKLKEFVFEMTCKQGGTVSAELGCGFRYRNYSHYSKSPEEIKLMKDVKKLLDPKGICNPYKVLPDED